MSDGTSGAGGGAKSSDVLDGGAGGKAGGGGCDVSSAYASGGAGVRPRSCSEGAGVVSPSAGTHAAIAAAMRTLPNAASDGGPFGTSAGETSGKTAEGDAAAVFEKLSGATAESTTADGETAGIFGAERTREAVDDGAEPGRGMANRDELVGAARREAASACEALAIGTEGRGGGSTYVSSRMFSTATSCVASGPGAARTASAARSSSAVRGSVWAASSGSIVSSADIDGSGARIPSRVVPWFPVPRAMPDAVHRRTSSPAPRSVPCTGRPKEPGSM